MKRNKGFTLIELLAVVVILAIILAIAVPGISNIMRSSASSAFQSDAKMILKAADYKKLENESFDPTIVNKDNIIELLRLSGSNYSNLKITKEEDNYIISIVGTGKWRGLVACGTYNNMRVVFSTNECGTDLVPPAITLNGDLTVNINVGGTYVDSGAAATDDVDGNLTNKISTTGTINPSIPGVYYITYTVIDSGGNVTTIKRTINVIDNVAPTISFNPNGNSIYAKGRQTAVTVDDIGIIDNTSLKYVWSTSTIDPSIGNFTNQYSSGDAIATLPNITGTYYLWVVAVDTAGNQTITRSNAFNLDNELPVITLNGDSEVIIKKGTVYADAGATATDNIDTNVNVTSTGSVNPSVIGAYTITYSATDGAGNMATKIRIVNVIDVGPVITTQITSELPLDDSVAVSIDYGTSVTKVYKVGNGSTWTNYTGTFNITSYDVINGNLKNSDGTVTLFVRGVDSDGYEKIESTFITNLDLDIPTNPVIVSNAGYPVIGYSGVVTDMSATVTYDSRSDVDNYYSFDGTNWSNYAGAFSITTSNVYAKSVKKLNGLTSSTHKVISMPTDIVGIDAYDNNDATAFTAPKGNYKIFVDPIMIGKKIRVKYSIANYRAVTISYLDASGNTISTFTKGTASYDEMYIIPANTYIIQFSPYCTVGDNFVVQDQWYLYEIQAVNEPIFTTQPGYMLLHSDPSKAITTPYETVTINYFPTSVQKLYQIGSTTGTWLTYTGPMNVNVGTTIYAKGIDQSGNQTRIISSYTTTVADAITAAAYDNNDTTSFTAPKGNYKIKVDPGMIGRSVRMKYSIANYRAVIISYLDASGNTISTFTKGTGSYDESYTIPSNTYYIQVSPYCTAGDNFVVQDQWYLYTIQAL